MSGRVTITINGRSFPIHCNVGEEDRIKELAFYVDEKAKELTKNFSGKINDLHLMVMVSLLIADELRDTLNENENLEQKLQEKQAHMQPLMDEKPADPRLTDPNFLKAVEMLASRMENIAENIQQR
ncbi:MAG: cell division protein ZapA [Alphaproteobacteria bacterium]|nr:cell division protein ZapA [Alphaproteobacteria bacterium]